MSPRKEKGAIRFLWEDKEVGGARDTIWSTWHSTIGWGVQNACGALGALAGGMASSLAVARGRMELVSCETGGAGELKLVKYPALPGAKARGFAGHASPPDAIRYLVEDSGVLSAGRDGCVMVWRRGDAPQDVPAVEDSNSHRHEQEVVGCAPRSVQGGFRRPSRGVLVRLSSGGQGAEMPTDAERALMEKTLAEDVAGVLHAGGHGDLSRPMEHLAFDRVRCSMFQDGAGGALTAEVELLPDPRLVSLFRHLHQNTPISTFPFPFPFAYPYLFLFLLVPPTFYLLISLFHASVLSLNEFLAQLGSLRRQRMVGRADSSGHVSLPGRVRRDSGHRQEQTQKFCKRRNYPRGRGRGMNPLQP